ncbi:MAG: acetylglutamate kinase [Bryobacteraceae bacterium]|nr:acetylglutamate kinase [Bryobacteraceae bacterium]
MKVLIKLGGTLLDTSETRCRLAREIAALGKDGHQIVVVHGGGKQMTRFLSERGVESRFVNGLRVSTPEVIEAVLKVLAGSVNRELVASLVAAGANAVGLCGIDGVLAEAEPISEELGAVGRIVRANAPLLDLLSGNGYLPVIACVAGDRQGRIYNVNADSMAVAIAAAFAADRLLFLTDVEGVRGPDGVIPELDVAGSVRLIEDGIATGGMRAKLDAACSALGQGVGQVVIAPGQVPGAAARLLAGEALGTRMVASRG